MSRDFLSLASELAMLPPDLTERVTAEAARTGESPEAIVSRRGLLSALQTDIVQTLLRPSEVVPGYELLSMIGHGGMGVVYRAKQKTLDRIVAIKTILVSQMSDRSMAARFEQEARAVAKLHHPNIIAAIDFGQHDGRLFFVMELVAGEDLESRIDRHQQSRQGDGVPETMAWGIARQAASGLAHAAEQGIVHRDIKPANLLLVEAPAGFPLPPGMPLVKIADFGLAFLASSAAEARTRLTAANTTVGSPHYIAPEQLGGQPVDARADIYALGATIFHLLAGRPPYTGLSLPQILAQKLTGETPRLRTVRDDISDETDSLVAAMMARHPDERVASYSELLRRIQDVCDALNAVTQSELPTATSALVTSASLTGTLATTSAFAGTTNQAASTDVMTKPSPRASDTKPLGPTQSFTPSSATATIPPNVPSRTRRRAWMAGIGTTALCGIGWVVMSWLRRGGSTSARPLLVPNGWSEPLFDGRSLKNWQPRSGAWILADDEDGAKVLSGTNGVIARRLLRGDQRPPRPLPHFALTLAARLYQAQAVEVHFGLLREGGENGPRFVLRVEQDTAWLAQRSADRGMSEPRTVPVPLSATNADQPQVLRILRDATHWFANVDDQLVGTLPLGIQPEHSEFRLFAEAGPAWFSDVEVEELAAPQ